MSYNAGIIGGNDLEFIAEYCRTAFNFIESNHLNDINSKDIHINNNILFEQILFYAQSNSYNKPVATVLDHSVRDNGYIYDDFCNFYYTTKPNYYISSADIKRTNGFVIYLAKLY